MSQENSKLKCKHYYKMNGDFGLLKLCHKCGMYFIERSKNGQ